MQNEANQSTNWIPRFVFTVAIAALTSFGTTSPLYSKQTACNIRIQVIIFSLTSSCVISLKYETARELMFTICKNVFQNAWVSNHVLSPSRIAFYHLVVWLKTHCSNVGDTKLFMISFFC